MAAHTCIWISLMLSGILGAVSGLSLTASPSNGMDVTTTTLDLQCVVDNALIPNNNILVVQLSKNDTQPIASFLVPSNKIKYAKDIDPQKLDVKWNFHDNATQSYLNLTFLYPREEDAGKFTCRIFYFNENYVTVEEIDTATVTWNALDMSRMREFVGDLVKKLHYLEEQLPLFTDKDDGVKDRLAILTAQTDNHSQELGSLFEGDSQIAQSLELLGITHLDVSKTLSEVGFADNYFRQSIEQYLNELEAKINIINNVTADGDGSFEILDMIVKADDLENKLQDLNRKETTKVVFTVSGIDSASIDTVHNMVKFKNLILNVGQAYDLQKGRFTAPVAGIYSFHLVVRLECSDCVYHFSINNEKGKIVTLIVGDRVNRDQSSISSVQELEAGKKVVVIVSYKSLKTGYHITPLKDDTYSLFTGYLVQEIS